MNKLKLVLTILSLFMSVLAFAQSLTVTGTVKDSSTGEPVPYAAIQLKGTQTGGMTDGDGVYSISVPADGVLIFSSVGYKDSEVPVAGKAVHDVELAPDTETIEETFRYSDQGVIYRICYCGQVVRYPEDAVFRCDQSA